MSNLADNNAFVFTGEALAFDFVNTNVVVRRKPIDLLATSDDLVDWWQKASHIHAIHLAQSATIEGEVWAHAKNLRGALHRIFTAVIENQVIADDDLAIFNGVLHDGYVQVDRTAEGVLVANRYTHPQNVLLLTIAQSAVWLLTQCDRLRLRKCKNDYCVLMFYDTTKNGGRVWCSTDCMNRARSSAHYRQQKEF